MNKFYSLSFLLFLTSCSTGNFFKSKPVAFGSYEQSAKSDRSPASVTVSALNFSILKDFVLLDDYGKNVRYRLETRFWTNKDERYLQKKLKKVIEKTMHDVLTDLKKSEIAVDKGENTQFSLTGSLKDHLIGHLIKEFVKTLYIYKIINGTFQIDISIVPIADSPENFDTELSSNQLIKLPRENSSLAEYLNNRDEGLPKRIMKVKFPQTEGDQFLAGNISIAFKLADFDINPLRPIPNPKKNAVKGQLIYRKYMRRNNIDSDSMDSKDFALSVTEIKDDSNLFTVDYMYKFNLSSLIPQAKAIDFHFGRFEGRGHYKTGIFSYIRSLFERKEKSIKKSPWMVKGSYKSIDFKYALKEMSFDVEDKDYDISGYMPGVHHSPRSNTQDNRRRRAIWGMEKNGATMVKHLKLESYFAPVMEEGEY